MLITYSLDINFDGLEAFPDSVQLDLPNGTSTLVLKKSFNARSGYLFRIDEDPPGTPDVSINPDATPNDMSYKWSGGNDEYDILFTVTKGLLTGYITSSQKRYGIEKRTNGTYWMIDFNLSAFPSEGSVIVKGHKNIMKDPPMLDNTFVTNLKPHNLEHKKNQQKGMNISNVVDMLVVWTEEARIEAGGSPSDSNDTLAIENLITISVDHANDALSNSETDTRVTKFYTAKLNGFSFSGDYEVDLLNFKDIIAIKQLRNLVGADVVTGIIKSDFNQFQACGAGFVQTFPNCGVIGSVIPCEDGIGFNDFAYNLVTRYCSIWDDTFTHELGHNLGGNHPRHRLSQGQVDSVINNGYPDAFAMSVAGFDSIISNVLPTTSRRLYFSNPDVTVDGISIGVLNEANNARIIDLLSPVVSNFRGRPDLIFVDGFE